MKLLSPNRAFLIGATILGLLFTTQTASANNVGDKELELPALGLEVNSLFPDAPMGRQATYGIRAAFLNLDLAAYLIPADWSGWYVRGEIIPARDAWSLSAGATGGFMFFGLEGGARLLKTDDGWHPGGEFSTLLTIGFIETYYRYSKFKDYGSIHGVGLRFNLL